MSPGPVRCPSCGAESPAGKRFCGQCGGSLTVVCASCGSAVEAGNRFCGDCGAPVDTASVPPPASPVAPAAPVAARRVTSVLFGDLVGFTALAESLDQEEVRELLGRYFEGCRQVIARYGGTVEKFIGDAVMAVWGVPAAHEDDAERSVRAALELVAAATAIGEDLGVADLAMRVGIVTGEVAVTVGAQQEGMVAGDPVNTAARVQSVAAPGQVWVDETTRLLTSSAITYVDAGTHPLKGKAEAVPLWAVRAVVAARGGAQRADGLEAPLVGRERELRLLKELFHTAEESGRPALVVVDGEAGVGKSRLGWELDKYVDGLSTGVRWHQGRCLAYGDGVAFYALAEAVRGRLGAATPDDAGDGATEPSAERLLGAGLAHWVPDAAERDWIRPRLAALLGTGAVGSYAREDLFSAWVTFFERVSGGEETVVLVVEDAQHADEGLLAFVEHLLTVATFPCFVVLLTRPGLLETHPALATNRRATVIHLPTLPEAEMSRLLDGLVAGLPAGALAELVARAEGVPLFAVETVRSLIDRDLVLPRDGQYVLADPDTLDLAAVGAPASLQALVSARLDALSAEQRRLVDRACVLGGSFRPEQVAALCPELDEPGRVLAELVRAQILDRDTSRLSSGQGSYGFAQSVVRQVAYATLSRRERKATHLAVVDLLGAEASEEVVPVIAQHYLDALEAVPGGDDAPELQSRALGYLRRAADRATGLGAPTQAAGFLAAALEHTADPAERAELQTELAWALSNAGSYDRAIEHASAATGAFDALGDDVAAGYAAAAHAQALRHTGGNEAACKVAEPRWATLQGRRDADRALLALGQSLTSARGSLGLNLREVAEETMLIAERTGSTGVQAEMLNMLALHYHPRGLRTVGQALLGASADLARSGRRPLALARALLNLNAQTLQTDIDASVGYGREALQVSSSTGSAYVIGISRPNLVLALLEHGSWAELEQVMADTPEGSRDAYSVPSIYAAVNYHLCLARGQDWTPPPAVGQQVDHQLVLAWQRLIDALAQHAHGRLAGAAAGAVQAAEAMLAASGRWDDFPFMWALAAGLTIDAGDEPAYRRLGEMADGDGEPVPLSLQAHRARATALWALRQDRGSSDAETHLRAAIATYERWGSTLRVARTRATLGALLADRGRTNEAAPVLEQARATFEQLGATAWIAGLDRQLLTGSGTTPR